MTDTILFRRKVAECGLKYKSLAKKLGISTYGLQRKINNLSEFKASEISALAEFMRLSTEERDIIFLAQK